ncbi:MAG: IclR family transcriptional regulator [Synergistota bacterium]|nr:IclR family transcriptional regulator [Synergistota bacterium]
MSSVEKAILLLKRLGEPPFEMSLTDLADEIEMGKSGAFKLLQAMKTQNIVIQDVSSRKYHLGPIMLRLGNVYSRFKGISEIAEPVMAHITDTTGETTYISLWEGDRAYPAYKHSRSGGIYDYNDFIGKSVPVNSGASAMLLCAYQPREVIDRILSTFEFEKRTPYTTTDPEEIRKEFKVIREQGYALEDEVFSLGIVSVSTPVFDRNNIVWACLSLAANKSDSSEEKLQRWIQILKDGAEELSYKLQFRH